MDGCRLDAAGGDGRR